MATYTTHGNVRGTCNHKHRSVESAARCMLADAAACKRMGGYSDRFVKRIGTGGDMEALTPAEDETVQWVEAK